VLVPDRLVRSGSGLHLLAWTLPEPGQNVACDEALLALCDAASVESLRIWESPVPAVVMGRSGLEEREVDTDACRRLGVPVVRRRSGGGTVLVGPGCLCWAVVISQVRLSASFAGVREAFDLVLDRIVAALAPLAPPVSQPLARAGISDLAIGDRKVSGSAQRRSARSVLVHGTVLYDLDLALVGRLLRPPVREPAYRSGRSHVEFLANLPASRAAIQSALCAAWRAWPALAPGAPACLTRLPGDPTLDRRPAFGARRREEGETAA
jgi:lipoate-protein ligase A